MNRLYAWCKKKMTKENMIVLALSGVLLMVAALPADGGKNKEASGETAVVSDGAGDAGQPQDAENADMGLEQRLEEFLSCMDGVGRVKVMITFSSSKEQIVEKDVPSGSISRTSENDGAGGSRSAVTREEQESTVYVTGRDGTRSPYVSKTLSARVEGVTVLAEGGGSRVIQKNITDVIEALFGIEAHKIKVAKMASPDPGKEPLSNFNGEAEGSRN